MMKPSAAAATRCLAYCRNTRMGSRGVNRAAPPGGADASVGPPGKPGGVRGDNEFDVIRLLLPLRGPDSSFAFQVSGPELKDEAVFELEPCNPQHETLSCLQLET